MVRRRTSARKKRAAYHALGAAPAKSHGAWVLLVLGALVLVNLYVFVWDKRTGVAAIKQRAEDVNHTAAELPSQPLAGGSGIAPSAASPRAPGVVAPPPHGPIEGKVGKADTLGRLLKKNGLTVAETDEVIRALTPVLDFKTIRPGQSFRIERGPDGRVKRFELEVSKLHHVRAERQASGELLGTVDDAR
jgi:hypothetical protein